MDRPGALACLAGVGFLGATLASGCATTLSNVATSGLTVRERSTDVVLDGETLTLHFALPVTTPDSSAPLVIFGSGDGGWFGTAVGMFRAIAGTGRRTAGFSMRTFMNIEHRRGRPLTAARLVADYQHVIAAARAELGLTASAPVVLAGWSRGAALSLLAASSHEPSTNIAGVVAIGLPEHEDLDLDSASDDDPAADRASPSLVGPSSSRDLALYPLIARMSPRRVIVIQASHDGYLPAARARQLFGDDSTDARLVDIDARNHRFAGAEAELASALVEAVNWVASPSTSPAHIH